MRKVDGGGDGDGLCDGAAGENVISASQGSCVIPQLPQDPGVDSALELSLTRTADDCQITRPPAVAIQGPDEEGSTLPRHHTLR